MRSVFWFLVILLTLVTAPALCQSGVAEHECASRAEASECSHDDACDPCGSFASASWRTAPQTPASAPAVLHFFCGTRVVAKTCTNLSPHAVRFDMLRRRVETSTTILVV